MAGKVGCHDFAVLFRPCTPPADTVPITQPATDPAPNFYKPAGHALRSALLGLPIFSALAGLYNKRYLCGLLLHLFWFLFQSV